MLCGSQNCGCAITSDDLSIHGSGTPGDPWDIGFATAGAFVWDYVFSNAAARDAAIISPTAGMQAYLTDNDTVWRYTGAVWECTWAPDMWLHDVNVPLVNDDSPTTPEAQWLTHGVTVPAWATSALVHSDLQYINTSAAGTIVYEIRHRLGGVLAPTTDVIRIQTDGVIRYGWSWSSQISAPATGSQSLEVYALRVSGAVQLRAEASVAKHNFWIKFFGVD